MKSESGFWERDEFEDAVATGIIALNEPRHPAAKRFFRPVSIKEKHLAILRRIGLYFPPADRVAYSGEIDIVSDGLPQSMGVAYEFGGQELPFDYDGMGFDSSGHLTGYLKAHWLTRARLPKGWRITAGGLTYMLVRATVRTDGLLAGREYVTINPKTGKVSPCVAEDSTHHCPITLKPIHKSLTPDDELPKMAAAAALTVGFWRDRRHLWNVAAVEGKARTLFGVYEAQVQSLFYARDLPRTPTGRRSPILHWVRAHRRRMQSGTEVDVCRHLRGVTEFEMGDTLFNISRPMKEEYAQKDRDG